MERLRNTESVKGLVVGLVLIGAIVGKCDADLSGWIVFNSSQDGDGDIWAVRANGDPASLRQLVNMPGHQGGPKWSPASRKVVYAYESEAQIWTHDWFTGTNTKIYDGDNYGGQFYITGPTWSPDGSKILFREDSSYNDPHITVINADGTGRAIVPVSGYAGYPSWSQTGTAFVYNKRSSGTYDDLWIYDFTATGNILTGTNHQLTQGASDDSSVKYEPDWAPNSNIAFIWAHNLAIIDPGTSPVWADPAHPNVAFLTTDAGYYTPSWSPDLTHLVYSRLKDGDGDLWTMDLSTLSQTRLIALPGSQQTPDWGNPVPVPGAALLGYIGVGTVLAVLRRHRKVL